VAALLLFGCPRYIGGMLWRVRNSRGKPINAPNHLFTLDAYFGRRILYCA
jgi:hypothetical protein